MKNLIILSILVLALFSCTNNQPEQLTEEFKTAIKQEVLEINEKNVSSLNLLDVDAMSEFWNETELICVNSDYRHFDSYSQFKDSVSTWFSNRESQNVTIKQANAEVLDVNLVLVTSILNWDITFKNGYKLNNDEPNSILWKKGEEGWKIIFLHESWK